MNKIAQSTVRESYKSLVRSVESPRFLDGVLANKNGSWNISYNKYGTPGIVTKDGIIKYGNMKLQVLGDGKLKRKSFRSMFMGKVGFERIGNMLNDIRHSFENPAGEAMVPDSIVLNFGPKSSIK